MKNMKSMMDKVRKGEGGLTLIELLIVIVILGIIGAVVALNVGGFLGAGTKEAAMLEKDAVQTAVLAAMIDGDCNAVAATANITGDPSGISLTCTSGGSGSTPTFEAYLQGNIDGSWTINESGLITAGTFTAGGVTCDYAAGSFNCS